MSESKRRSVSERSSKPEEIFLQAVDGRYEVSISVVEEPEFSDLAKFFEEYEQSQNMKDMITNLENLDYSTDYDSAAEVSRSDSVSSLSKFRALSIRSLLKDGWERSLLETKRSQSGFIKCSMDQNQIKIAPFNFTSRTYSNSLPSSKFSFIEYCPFGREKSENSETCFNVERVKSSLTYYPMDWGVYN